MTSWTKPMTWVAQKGVTSTQMNLVRDNLKNLDERLTLHGITSESTLNKVKTAVCGVRVNDSGSQTITELTESALTWDTEVFDTDGFHSTVSSTGRITIPAGLGGYYLVSTAVRWDVDSGGSRSLWVADSGGTIRGRTIDAAANSAYTIQTLTFLTLLDAGEWIAVWVYHNAGNNLALAKSLTSTNFSAYRLFAT